MGVGPDACEVAGADDCVVHPTFSLGRVAGVEIGVNWSWAIIFTLIVWSLAATVFPDQNPDLANGTYIAMAFAAAVLFFASLLLHELGHAVQARRDGMEIEGITLWLFGGVARFRGELPSAGAELRMALAGPLVTLVLGSAFVVLALLAQLPEAVDGVAAWLGYINLFLLAFNLLPALPLDGGRVLRATLWGAKGDFAWATVVAVDVGRGFGYLMIGGGLLLFVVQGALGGAWLAFLGWFLLGAAGMEARHLAVRVALAGLKVGHVMIPDPVTADPDQTLGEFMDGVAGVARYTAYPVVRNGAVLGVLPLRCVLEAPRREWEELRVRECMLARDEVPLLRRDEDALQALEKLSAGDLHRGLVLDDGHLAGFVSISDIAKLLAEARPRKPSVSAR
jgi:Zn-dependent protease/predicted transcriptional regulator